MCSVVGCDSGRHRFKLPEDPERRLEWVQFLLEVNEQRLKESSWTDITICNEHFTSDCFEQLTSTGTVQLKSSAVPSLCVKPEPDEPKPCQLTSTGTVELKSSPVPSSCVKPEPDEPEPCQLTPTSTVQSSPVPSSCVKPEPDEPEPCQEPENTEVTSEFEIRPCDSPHSYSGESGLTSEAAQESPAPSDASDDFTSDYIQMLQNVENIDMIREKAALLQMKGKYVVNEKRLLQLFNHKCPSCGSKLKMEKVTCGTLLILNQQCLQCEYRNQWKSRVNASIPAAEDQQVTEVEEEEITPESQQTAAQTLSDKPESVVDEESDPDEMDDSGDEDHVNDSDEDWEPVLELSLLNELYHESEEETEEEDEDDDDDDFDPLSTKHSQLCPECGMFFDKRKPHTCEHKTKPYCCNTCGKRCASEVALNSHSRIHDENYEHRCKYCQDTFKTKVDKITHQQIHLNQEKPYKCPDCSETFATNKERIIHLEDHRGPRQLKCHICGIDFTYTTCVRRHMAVHTGEKPFKCSVCQRCFNQASHLKSHMRLHTGERPFQCQHCGKSFNHNVSLKSHVQRYHSSSSGQEGKKGKGNKSEAQENGNKNGTDSGLNDVEEEVQKEGKHIRKPKKRSTGRPKGRPKRDAEGNLVVEGETQGQRSNTKTAKVRAQKLKRRHCSDEESEDEPAESVMSFDSTEEDSEKVTLSTNRSRGRSKKTNSDSEFDPEERKKKRQNSEKSSGRRRGRPRNNPVVK